MDIDTWLAHFAMWPNLRADFRSKPKGKPGEMVLNAPAEIKEQLKGLKAENICRWRPDLLKIYLECSEEWRNPHREETRRLIAEFDSKLAARLKSVVV